jgi:hypothetical protein
VSWLLKVVAAGEGNQCATITASGATIAATAAWFAQNAAIAGVAAFATTEIASTAVGKYALYFFREVSPRVRNMEQKMKQNMKRNMI